MSDLTHSQIGRAFVKHYYTTLCTNPNDLRKLYKSTSTFVHGGDDCLGEADIAIGVKEIGEKIAELNFQSCRTRILQVDSARTLENGIVVQVCGEISNNNGALRRFMQTFVLCPVDTKLFYVANDIFRYQDEVFGDSVPSTNRTLMDTVKYLSKDHVNRLNYVNTTAPQAYSNLQAMHPQVSDCNQRWNMAITNTYQCDPSMEYIAQTDGTFPYDQRLTAQAGNTNWSSCGMHTSMIPPIVPSVENKVTSTLSPSSSFVNYNQYTTNLASSNCSNGAQIDRFECDIDISGDVASHDDLSDNNYPIQTIEICSRKPYNMNCPNPQNNCVYYDGPDSQITNCSETQNCTDIQSTNQFNQTSLTTSETNSCQNYCLSNEIADLKISDDNSVLANVEQNFTDNDHLKSQQTNEKTSRSWASIASSGTSKKSIIKDYSNQAYVTNGKNTYSSGLNDTQSLSDKALSPQPVFRGPLAPNFNSTSARQTIHPVVAPRYPEENQVFVGNVANSVSEQTLIDLMSSYGPILDVKLSERNNIDKPKFAFVVFENAISADNIIADSAQNPMRLYGKRLNIEHRNPSNRLTRKNVNSTSHPNVSTSTNISARQSSVNVNASYANNVGLRNSSLGHPVKSIKHVSTNDQAVIQGASKNATHSMKKGRHSKC